MFANAFRTHARLVLASARPRTFTTGANLSRLLPSALVPRAIPCRSRSLFTSPLAAAEANQDETSARFEVQDMPDEQARYLSKKPTTPSSCLYVANLPFDAVVGDVQQKFDVFGEIVNIRLAKRSDGAFRGFAHVEFRNEEDAQAAFESAIREPIFLFGRELRMDYAANRIKTQNTLPSNRLYFHHFDGKPRDVWSLFQENNIKPSEIFFLKNRQTGDFQGNGFITFEDVDEASSAMLSMGNSGISLEYARPRSTTQEGNFRDRQRAESSY